MAHWYHHATYGWNVAANRRLHAFTPGSPRQTMETLGLDLPLRVNTYIGGVLLAPRLNKRIVSHLHFIAASGLLVQFKGAVSGPLNSRPCMHCIKASLLAPQVALAQIEASWAWTLPEISRCCDQDGRRIAAGGGGGGGSGGGGDNDGDNDNDNVVDVDVDDDDDDADDDVDDDADAAAADDDDDDDAADDDYDDGGGGDGGGGMAMAMAVVAVAVTVTVMSKVPEGVTA